MILYKRIKLYISVFAFAAVSIVAAVVFLGEVHSLDIWLHLETGKWILENLKVPTEQLYSFLLGPAPWIDHSWLFQAFVYPVYSVAGANGLILLRCLLLFGIIAFIACIGRKAAFGLIGVLTFLALVLTLATRTHVRPELFSLFFTAAFLYILKKYPEERSVFILLPLQLLWVNIHGYFLLGPAAILLFLICQHLKRGIWLPFEWSESAAISTGAMKRLYIVLFLSIATFFISPYGLRGAFYPFSVLTNLAAPSIESACISELVPVGFFNIVFTDAYLMVTLLVFLFFLSLFLSIRKADIYDIILCALAIAAVTMAKRNQAIFGVIMSICIMSNLNRADPAFLKRFSKGVLQAAGRGLVLAGLIGVIFYCAKVTCAEVDNCYIYDKDLAVKSGLFGTIKVVDRPGAMDLILKNRLPGPIFNSINCAAYMTWNLYPEYRIFVDGRTELYKAHEKIYLNIDDYQQWKKASEQFSFKTAVFFFGFQNSFIDIASELYKDKAWKLVFFDNIYMVFLKDIPENRKLIKKYRIRLEDIEFSLPDDGSLTRTLAKNAYPLYYVTGADVLMRMGKYSTALSALDIASRFRRGKYPAYIFKGACYFHMKEYEKALAEFLKALPYSKYKSAELYTNIGSSYAKLGRLKSALRYFRFALQVDPKDQRVQRYIEMTEDKMKEVAEPQ